MVAIDRVDKGADTPAGKACAEAGCNGERLARSQLRLKPHEPAAL